MYNFAIYEPSSFVEFMPVNAG